MAVTDYLREKFMPHIWCPGCGHGIVLNSLIRAVEQLGIEKNDVVMVSGIGCSARMAGYLDFHTMHTLHGRALGFATGAKMGNPALKVIVPMGDGDSLAIGGNHFIHAARRNMDVTAIVMNNNIYGMTGGQFSPATPTGMLATTAPYGTIDEPFNVVELAKAAGASYVSRCTTYHVNDLIKQLKEGIEHKGFSVIEIMDQCPTYYGRKNLSGDAVDMLKHFKDNAVRIGKGTGAPNEIEIGVFVSEERPEYCEKYENLVKEVQGGKNEI